MFENIYPGSILLYSKVKGDSVTLSISILLFSKPFLHKTYNLPTFDNSFVYIIPVTTHRYLGCYVDEDVRAVSDEFLYDPSMTLNKCFDHCRSAGKRYAALQDGGACFCGDSHAQYDMYGKADADSECGIECAGNNKQMCGDEWKNSVYDLWGKI